VWGRGPHTTGIWLLGNNTAVATRGYYSQQVGLCVPGRSIQGSRDNTDEKRLTLQSGRGREVIGMARKVSVLDGEGDK